MTITQYRESVLSAELAEMLKHPILKTAIETLDAAAPVNAGANLQFKEAHMAYVQLGIDRGYALYSNLLKALAIGVKKQEEVQPTYEPPVEAEV